MAAASAASARLFRLERLLALALAGLRARALLVFFLLLLALLGVVAFRTRLPARLRLRRPLAGLRARDRLRDRAMIKAKEGGEATRHTRHAHST